MRVTKLTLLIGYFLLLGSLIALTLSLRNYPYFPVGFFFALYSLLTIYSLVTGEAPSKRADFQRSGNPLGYWMLTSYFALSSAVWGVIAVMCLWTDTPPGCGILATLWLVSTIAVGIVAFLLRRV
jgi:hypothetical protein